MVELSVNYAELVRGLAIPLTAEDVGAVLLEALAERYERCHPGCLLLEFEQAGATYLFDQASAVGAEQEDRTVAAWAVTPAAVSKRDKSYQRGFPLSQTWAGDVDRGHLIPHMSGGEFGPNIFKQDRDLNQGRSDQGRRYRAMEREAAKTPGAFYFGHLLYEDDTAYPAAIETGLIRGSELYVEQFRNRF
ncbi:hypothetical protein [Flindersiella endophytica]